MTIAVDSTHTYEQIGQREDLINVITRISPTEAPLVNNSGSGSTTAILHEWQTEELRSAAQNSHLEGDNPVANDAANLSARIGNRLQISREVAETSRTVDKVSKAGRGTEHQRQILLKGLEIRRDLEFIACGNTGSAAGSTTVARTLGGLAAFVKTNVSFGTGGVNPVWTTEPDDPRTDGTQRPFAEADLNNVAQLVWDEGGNPTTLMTGGFNKRAVAGFSGNSAMRVQMPRSGGQGTIIGGVDTYQGDFDTFSLVPNRFSRARDAWIIDWNMIELIYLDPMVQEPLAKNGDSQRTMIVTEWTLKVKQEKGLGLIADLNTA